MSDPTTRGGHDGEMVRAAPSPVDHTGHAAALQATAAQSRMLDLNDEQLATRLSDLVRQHLERGELAEAEPPLLRLLELRTAGGDDRSDVATILASLATIRHALGRHESAERLWRRVLAIRERSLAPNHFAIARSIEHLADTCAAQGKLEESLALLQRAAAMQEQGSGETSPNIQALRAKIADLRLLALQERTGPGAARANAPGSSPAAAAEPPSHDRDMLGTPAQPSQASRLLALTAAGIYADAESDGGSAAGSNDAHEAWQNSDGRKPRAWRSSAVALAERARDHWRHIAIAAAALIVVPLGIVASTHRGSETAPPARSRTVAVSVPAGRGEAAGMLANPTTAPRTTPDTVATAAAAPIDARRSAAPAPQPTGAADARRADVPVPDVKSIRLPDAMGAAQSSMSRRMDSTLHALTGNGLAVGTGEYGSGRAGGASAIASPADLMPPALVVGSPMPEYPPSLRSEAVSGGVLAEFVVDANGRADVSTLEVLHSDNRLFTAAVRKALPNMQFVPAESSGHRIPQRLQMPFRFTPGSR